MLPVPYLMIMMEGRCMKTKLSGTVFNDFHCIPMV